MKPIQDWKPNSWPFGSVTEYLVDAGQRSFLFLDVMRRRSDDYREHMAKAAPHVLSYAVELIIDGRTLERPVNYVLARVMPPSGTKIDPDRRPFVVVDPRAGHGPGIGGFKAESEIGVVFKAGHPCYFIGFLPEPEPQQTIEDIAHAEAIFLEKVISLHPDADGEPCVIGNCQAGWAVMILAARRPELFGPIIIAGSPLSYWAGVRGQNPMRYSGGLLGGSWLTALTSDLGNGKFDGAWLIQNFENQNPANTLWSKPYNLYANIDTEADRYLTFERWWGGHVTLNGVEIQAIVDDLFIGNKLAAGTIRGSDGSTVDLRNIRSPIVVFCSKGDNITPPQQALGWILQLYDTDDEIRTHGQTIVYTIHESAGHLGIFVSTGVARKEYGEFSSNIDLIDVLPPGLYEAVFEANTKDSANRDLITGDWVMRCEPRSLADIRALGGNDLADERRFATAARVSEVNLTLYRAFVQPFVRAIGSAPVAQWMRALHPLRMQYALFPNANPFATVLQEAAKGARDNRQVIEPDNPFLAAEKFVSEQITSNLDLWRRSNEMLAESVFLAVYGSPALQEAVGIDPSSSKPQPEAGEPTFHRELLKSRIEDLRSRIGTGGLRECLVRGMLYVGMSRGGADERTLAAIRRLRTTQDPVNRITLKEFKKLLRDQFFMLLIDQEKTLEAIPSLLPAQSEARQKALSSLTEVLRARGELEGEAATRLVRVAKLFGVPGTSKLESIKVA